MIYSICLIQLVESAKFAFYRREREKDREKRDDRSPTRRISPKRRTRPIPRYNVQVPKMNLNA